jgi:class 3 adenylate cyclase
VVITMTMIPANAKGCLKGAVVPQDTAERRQVTVMFSDLVGSTALSARMDPRPAATTARVCLSLLGKTRRRGAAIAYENSCLHIWIALRARFRTMPPSRTALFMIIARFGRSPFCRTAVEQSLSGTGEGSMVTVFS